MQRKRRVYLDMKSAPQARKIFLEHFQTHPWLKTETVPAVESVGRILAQPVFARLSNPHYHAAAMDGIAVQASDTYGASESQPLDLTLESQAVFVNTGHRLPNQKNAVIMIEDVEQVNGQTLRIRQAAYPWQYVRKVGEDIVATQMLFPTGHLVSPTCLGALLSGGAFEVAVTEKPRVLIIPTGNELDEWESVGKTDLAPGRVVESNSWVLGHLVEQVGGQWERNPIVPDDFSAIQKAVATAAQNGRFHLVLVLAGSSAGSEDHTANVVESLGRVLVHGAAIMPGKPVILGKVGDTPVAGMPGYPVSSVVAFDEFVRPLLLQLQGRATRQRPRVTVEAARKVPGKLGLEELVRVKLGRVGEKIMATPLPRGAGSITSFTQADGILRIPKDSEGINPSTPVEAELLRAPDLIDKTIVAVGSHDNTLDLLADLIAKKDPTMALSSAHVGSMGGLMAVKSRACHVAGTHLLDAADGTYNTSYLKKHLAGVPLALIHLVGRDQGLMVARGNPKNIRGIGDLTREDLIFINRQGGSGTRILLDFKLLENKMDPMGIRGYDNAEFTHMAVAAAVQSQAADAGLGILAAARALDLDFIPVVTEQYDLVIPLEFLNTPMIQTLMEVIQSNGFKERVREMGGYHLEKTGEMETLE